MDTDSISQKVHYRKFILASASPRRAQLLAELGLSFTVVTAQVEEHEDPDTDPTVMVLGNASLKADWVSSRNPEAWVLGADTTVCVDNKALNKPRDLDDARRMLRCLSGRIHVVYTGLAIRHQASGLARNAGIETKVHFRPLSEALIENYLAKVHVLDKAGAYAIQEFGELLVERIEGSYTNIVGLPMESTKQMLSDLGLL